MADFDAVSGGLLDSAMSTAQIGGHFYGLALNTNTKILFYNQKALEDAGLPVPADMDEFVDTVKKLSGNNENGQQVWGYNEPAWQAGTCVLLSGAAAGSLPIPARRKLQAILTALKP